MTRAGAPPLSFSTCLLRRMGLTARGVALSGLLVALQQTVVSGQPPQTIEARPTSQLFTARADHLALERAKQCFEAGKTIEGVAFLRQVLDGTADSFVSHEGETVGARVSVRQVLEELPTVSRKLYETQQATAAAAALRDASEHHSLDALSEVARRFPSTEPGFRASDRLAAIAFDRGDFQAAARLWGELIDDPLHEQRIAPSMVARMLVALHRTGQDGRAATIAVRFREAHVRVGGHATRLSDVVAGLEPFSPPLATTGRVATASADLTPPAFPPLWQHTIDATAADLNELWSASRRAEARPVATPTGAVFIEDRVIVRGTSGLSGYDTRTGELVWQASLPGSVALSAFGNKSDLHDLSRFEDSYGANGVLGGISADDQHIYVLDRIVDAPAEVQTASRSPVPLHDQQQDGDRSNRLLALPIVREKGSSIAPVWTVGANLRDSAAGPLAGHYFFGPPVVSDGRLLAITEKQQRLNLIALDPANGRLIWQQPLGFVPKPVTGEPVRATTPCQPAVVGGIAVCGTNAGFVVAVDVATGRLLWAYDYSKTESSDASAGEWSADRSFNYGDSAIVSPIVARGDSVVLLPSDSQRVHCLDVETGMTRWTAPREEGLYVACVTEQAAVVSGKSHCRSYSIVSGSLLWSVRLGAPAGTGIVTDTLFMSPLQSGVVAAVELATGRRVGFDSPRLAGLFVPIAEDHGTAIADRWRPGNLFTHDGSLYSIGAFEVCRLETARAALARHRQAEQLNLLESARIELASGELNLAQSKLEGIVTTAVHHQDEVEAKRLLRELHYLRLPKQSEREMAVTLAQLDRLSDTPSCRGRFLLKAVEQELAFDDPIAARARIDELSRLQLTEPLAVPHEATHLVTVAGWMPAVLRRLDRRSIALGQPLAELPLLSDDDLRQRLLCCRDDGNSAQIRLELARRAIADGEFHRAEIMLLRAGRDGHVAEEATGELALLRKQCGVDVACCEDSAEPTLITSVQIAGKLWKTADDGLCKAFGRSRRGFTTRFQEPLRIVDRGSTHRASLAIVDLEEGVCRGEIAVDARLRFPSVTRQPFAGHFVPVATVDRLYGLSMLEARQGAPAWEVALPGRDGLLPQLGPYGPSFCSIQTRRELTVVDPANGDTLWQRIELPPDRGLNGDHSAGLFGDEEALTLLDADGISYTVYRTATGEELSRGRLPIDHRRQRKVYGRKLFFIESSERGMIARLWDPAQNLDDFRIAFEGKLLQTSTRDDLLAMLFENGRLLIVDPKTAQPLIDIVLNLSIGDVHTIQVFSDAERFYVSLYQADPARFDEARVANANYVYDTPLTVTNVQGRVVAIDRRSEEILWSRMTEQRSILDPVEHPLPFLVAVARISDRNESHRKTLLVEAIDKRTGDTLGVNDRLLPDQLLQVRHDRREGCVELRGMTSTVTMNFTAELPAGGLAGVTTTSVVDR